MSHAVTPPPAVEGPPVSVVDDRLAEVSLLTKLLRRPELGALLGALVVGIFFAATAASFRTLGGMANWTDVASTLGIMAVVVALLMIGGEFDLSAGRHDRHLRPAARPAHHRVGLQHVAGHHRDVRCSPR